MIMLCNIDRSPGTTSSLKPMCSLKTTIQFFFFFFVISIFFNLFSRPYLKNKIQPSLDPRGGQTSKGSGWKSEMSSLTTNCKRLSYIQVGKRSISQQLQASIECPSRKSNPSAYCSPSYLSRK